MEVTDRSEERLALDCFAERPSADIGGSAAKSNVSSTTNSSRLGTKLGSRLDPRLDSSDKRKDKSLQHLVI